MKVIDGHSHIYQEVTPANQLKKNAKEIEDFDINLLLRWLDQLDISQIQIMPQEMTRIHGLWLGSNELSADIQQRAPERLIAFACAEPLDIHNVFNRARLKEVEGGIVEKGLKGLLLTPPYGHYYSNDRRVYPFYEKAVELGIPIYFHHSHGYMREAPGCPATVRCPLKYAKILSLEDVAIDFPELRFNVEHLGHPWEEELFALMTNHPNVYTDIAMFIEPTIVGKGRRLLLARDLGMAREYGVLNRVFWGSDYVGESVEEYVSLVQRETSYITEGLLNQDMERLGWPPLTEQEMEGLLFENVLKLWQRSRV